MKTRKLAHLLSILLCWAVVVSGQLKVSREEPPVLLHCTPTAASVGAAMNVEGYHLGADHSQDVQVVFVHGGVQRGHTCGGSSWSSNDLGALQHLFFYVPDGLTPGPCQVEIEVGKNKASMNIEITDWVPPLLQKASPPSARPGERAFIEGTGFNVSDTLEIVDAQGETHRLEPSHASDASWFTLPEDLAEGEATLHIVNPRGPERSNALSMTISKGPQPLDLWPDELEPVGAGQWMGLVATSGRPLEQADRAEVAFVQHGTTIISQIVGIKEPRVRVPQSILPGDVELMTRTWKGGKASSWSSPVRYRVLDKPAPTFVEGIKVGDDTGPYVCLHPGPDKPDSFDATPGQVLRIIGKFHFGSSGKIEVSLEGGTGPVSLAPEMIVDPVSIRIEVPDDLPDGDWEIVLGDADIGGTIRLPVTVRVRKSPQGEGTSPR